MITLGICLGIGLCVVLYATYDVKKMERDIDSLRDKAGVNMHNKYPTATALKVREYKRYNSL